MLEESKLKKLLLDENYISKESLVQAEAYAKIHNVSAINFLLQQGLLTKQLLGQAIAEGYGLVFADFESSPATQLQVLKLPETLSKSYRVVVYKEDAKNIIFATDVPSKEILAAISPYAGKKKVSLAFAITQDIDEALLFYRKKLQTRFSEIISQASEIGPELVDQIIEDALLLRSSDIHFLPNPKEVLVRFRIDGVLTDAGKLPKEYYEIVVNRLKVQAKLRIDEHQSAQDGAIRFVGKSKNADLRISILPTTDGEKVVIRLLGEYVRDLNFEALGLSEKKQTDLKQSAAKPFGMILVTGPTGSGKTTTLYSLVKILNQPEVSITTIEDPVEYKINGISQTQVNNQTNITFAKGLRSIARQDPDIILVGEIRDLETAEIAINAALTGHLLLSTFHANDAISSIPRLLDMGIEPFLLASTLDTIIAQRLCRKICQNCRVSELVTPSMLQKISPAIGKSFGQKSVTLYSGKGCSVCNNSGYKGRVGIFEFLKITPELQDVIVQNPASKNILNLAKSQGFSSMWEDGIEKVKSGTTTIQELLRVAMPS